MIFLLACGGVGLDATKPPPGSDTESPVTIEKLDPNWGPTDGGTAVEIAGSGFDGAVSVAFGNLEVAATRLDATTLLITTPYLGFEAAVDVTVNSDLGSATLPGGFTYSDDGPPVDTGDSGDSGDTTTSTDDTGVNPSGLNGGFVELNLMQYACPSCVGATSSLTVGADAVLHSPAKGSWIDWLPRSGTCTDNPTYNVPNATIYDVGEWTYLTSGSVSVGLRKSVQGSDTTYVASGLDETDYVRNAQYAFSVPAGGDLPAFEVSNALLTPQSIASLTPTEMLYTNMRDAFSARISKSGQTFTWTNSGGNGSFVIRVDIYKPDGSAQLGSITCQGPDNGAMLVPGAWLGSYPTGGLLLISMTRYSIGSFVRPVDGATMEAIAQFGVTGTGILVP